MSGLVIDLQKYVQKTGFHYLPINTKFQAKIHFPKRNNSPSKKRQLLKDNTEAQTRGGPGHQAVCATFSLVTLQSTTYTQAQIPPSQIQKTQNTTMMHKPKAVGPHEIAKKILSLNLQFQP